ncbi:MAG TPA: hypothetical protein DFS52_21465, partial [Myxococcales bacterium]|nr:hypothetical protein [Myxococcales bacterium]
CHGYETAPALEAAGRAGVPGVGVVHYSVAQETVHDLGCADDPSRRRAVGAWLPLALSRASPRRLRVPLVRVAGRAGRLARPPLPTPLRAQLAKLGLEARLMRGAARVVAVGRAFAGSLRRLYPDCRERVSWCFAGVTSAGAPGLARAGDERRRLLMVGRPMPQKGWEYAAEALHLLEDKKPALAERLELTVVSGLADWRGPLTGYAGNVLRRFEGLRRVRFREVAQLGAAALAREYATADFLLHPSVFEPFGLVLVEAMQHGCLPLASDADGPRDLVRPEFGWLVPFGEPRARVARLAGALGEACGLSRAELEGRREAARRAAAGFSWEECARGHLRALEEARAQGA